MPTNREISESNQANSKNDGLDNLFVTQFPKGQDSSAGAAGQKTLAESFRESYRQMHQEIYSELYKPLSGTLLNPPEWLKYPRGLSGGDGAVGKESEFDKRKNKSGYSQPAIELAGDKRSASTAHTRSPWLLPDLVSTLKVNQPGADAKSPDSAGTKPEPGRAQDKDIFELLHSHDGQETDISKNMPLPGGGNESQRDSNRDGQTQIHPESRREGEVTQQGNRLHINYPGSDKTREIIFDAGGKAREITTKDQSGSMHIVRKGDDWVAQIQGLELKMPGKIEAGHDGDVTFEMGQGIYRREKSDGTTVQEKTNADGARLSFNNNNQVEKLTRKDGSSVQISQDGKNIVETLPASNRQISWTKKDDGAWTADSGSAQPRKNFQVDANGATSWNDSQGLKYVVRGDGSMMAQQEGQARMELDGQNRVKSIDYGSKDREFEYFGNSGEIQKTVIKDVANGSTVSFTREKPGSDRWTTDNGQTWTGDIKVGPNGVYSFKPSGASIQETDRDGRWYTMWPDKNITRDVIGSDGSRLSYDTSGKLRKALSQDGTSADISENKITINNPRSGEKVTWTKEGEGWKSDLARFSGSKSDLQINEKCQVSFTAADGNKHAIRPDGKEVITRKDGVQLELNDQQQIDRISKGDSDRTIERDAAGSIIRVLDKNKTGERSLLDRRAADGIGSVEINKDGDLLIKRLDNSSKLEKGNFSSVTSDKDGSPLQVTNQRGDSRTFKWTGDGADKKVTEIEETRKTAGGNKTETWTRKSDSNDFVAPDGKGKEKIRHGLQLLPDGSGDYTYKSKDGGKDAVARLGSDNASDLSASVEEARDNLLDEMREKLPEANSKRMQEMMQNFEKRMSDRAGLRKIAGLKTPEAIDDEVQKDVQSTYDNLRQMVSKGDGGTYFDQKTRVKLAENFMYHAMEPTTIDQGPASERDPNGHGTCWISSGQIWGMTQHPGAMADYLKQVCLNGQVTTKNGGEGDSRPQTYTFSRGLLTFDKDKQESLWTIGEATTKWREDSNSKTEIIGDRSPVSKIFDYTLPVLSGSRKEFDVDGGLYDTADIVGQGHTRGVRDILFMVTGDAPVDKGESGYSDGHLLNNNLALSLAEKGSVLNYAPGHLHSLTVRQVDNKWYLIQDDQHGENEDKVLAQISDIKRWVKGDRSVEQPVDISVMDLLHKKHYSGSGDADRLGAVTPRQAGASDGSSRRSRGLQPVQSPRVAQAYVDYSGYGQYPNSYLPPVELIYP